MQTDAQLQHDILAELRWEPSVTHDHIHVAVTDGIVTLSGVAANYAEKIAAEKVARRVSGVRAIADEIDVGAASADDHDDTGVARRVASVLEWHVSVPAGRIRIKVEKGIVTLTGRVDWKFQSEAARKAIAGIAGVTGIANLLEVHNPVCAQDIRDGIEAAYKRLASLDKDAIVVDIDGSKVILTGRVYSYHERDVAERAAWASPGVTEVRNDIVVARRRTVLRPRHRPG
ncbi:BON domain-containing protein [Sphingomonas oryzagri]